MTARKLSVSFNPQQPPLLLLALAQLQGLDSKELTFCPNSEQHATGLVALQQQEEQQHDCRLEHPAIQLPELEAAKRIAFTTPIGQLLLPDADGEALFQALLSVLLGVPFSGSLYTGGFPRDSGLKKMNAYLSLRTFLWGHRLSLVDLGAYIHLRTSAVAEKTGALPEKWSAEYPAIARWYGYMHNVKGVRGPVEKALKQKILGPKPVAASPDAAAALADKAATAKAKEKAETQASYEGKLEGAEMGKVVTRFPPEPSGYLHIGHAKAALLNGYFAKKYQGRMIFRFDDTNPAKENGEFEESILEDTKLLGVEWEKVTHTSDYLQQLQDACTEMIKKGIFYVDNTPTEQMRYERGEGIESASRSLPVEEHLRRWEQMKEGTAEGQQCCVRAKIDMQCKNKCMRDPVMFRCVVEPPHHRMGRTFKAYPTYDFACPVVDSWEGVTHALRTNEYADRIPQYHWVQEAMGLRKVNIYEFSRLCFVRTVLSKRKLKYFVTEGLVTGWDDPRMPTVRGILRRGLTVEALLEFILQQGPSKAGNLMEWDKLWTLNKQVIDPIVPRFMAVSRTDGVKVTISGAPENVATQPRRLHAKNEALGQVPLYLYNTILIETDDAQLCQDGEEVTLMHWGNCIFEGLERDSTGKVTAISAKLHLEGDFKKTKKKLNWVPMLPPSADVQLTPLVLREYDHLITVDKIENESEEAWEECINRNTQFDTEALGDPNLRALKEGDKLQLERRGYFRVDAVAGDSLVLIKIPDGRAKAMSTVSSKVNAAALSGAKIAGKSK
ncbi:glutamyl-tRNA synthetase, putative [Eimeria necatrix]|uniref:glutamate--tRNA ligase n=1 Tax=Eimeria necatrix TaxID=51315 RepID=U6MZH6_9EIME|nr:glutamyl-tRNA synthetase, putative [Eimeria necatrix]CDJ69608.1 glutamyl-tRNA synthetase, putative [Eimeria necatrix]